MKNIDKNQLLSEIDILQEDLQEMIDKSEKILGYKSESVNQVVNDLLILNTDKSRILANDILEIDNDINILENYQEEIFKDDPFYTLKSEDEDD